MTDNTNLNNNTENNSGDEVRNNLREAGDALLSAGSAIGAALTKATGELSDRFKTATEDARQNLSKANTEGEVRGAATNFTDEAEKLFNSLRERDLQFTDDVKAKLRSTIDDARAAFNERLDGTQTEGIEGTVDDLRTRFEGLVQRIQDQFAGEKTGGDIIDGEVVDNTTNTVNVEDLKK
ncbi:hypothetical protein HMPREF3151_09580 [Corynebacterium sp. HMSC05H05]|uniref:CGLAU_01105 family protein n=1 Tax=unclassified Corynebacterium TaxID=2624378 RepID=UPI0008A1D867|nr:MULTISPECIES: CGLAU_01105 family protein [unclassified Corynebacterium]OFT56930.1 hypothetical protein HMPREF3151_09580 [Corynebacterium sp. HMSC05H05]OHR20541.1 hypothetical protein HMPREF2791_09830 [Corynebacterium sp. HMSC034A01]